MKLALSFGWIGLGQKPRTADECNDEFNKVYNNLKKINHYLELSLSGIQNLKKTYNSDIVTDSKLDIILNNTELYNDKITKKINVVNNINIFLQCFYTHYWMSRTWRFNPLLQLSRRRL